VEENLTSTSGLEVGAAVSNAEAGMVAVARNIAQVLDDRIRSCLLNDTRAVSSWTADPSRGTAPAAHLRTQDLISNHVVLIVPERGLGVLLGPSSREEAGREKEEESQELHLQSQSRKGSLYRFVSLTRLEEEGPFETESTVPTHGLVGNEVLRKIPECL
jgi:hypothetical protein